MAHPQARLIAPKVNRAEVEKPWLVSGLHSAHIPSFSQVHTHTTIYHCIHFTFSKRILFVVCFLLHECVFPVDHLKLEKITNENESHPWQPHERKLLLTVFNILPWLFPTISVFSSIYKNGIIQHIISLNRWETSFCVLKLSPMLYFLMWLPHSLSTKCPIIELPGCSQFRVKGTL